MSHATSATRRRASVGFTKAVLSLSLGVASVAVVTLTASPASAGVTSTGRSLLTQLSLRAHVAPGTWGTAIEVPGTSTLNAGNNAGIYAVSCSASGYCSAGGQYTDASGHSQAFVVNETAGVWGTAIEVPGTSTLNVGGNASVSSVSCSSTGDCGAAGYYTDASGDIRGFVVNEQAQTWDAASEVNDPSAIGSTAALGAESISCTATGDCTAVGDDVVSGGSSVGFAVTETSGAWSDAVEITITSSFGAGGTSLDTVSCSSPGNCSAAGNGVYPDSALSGGDANIPFVVQDTDGTWGNPEAVPGLATLNVGQIAVAVSISCSSAGNCGVGGTYTDGSNTAQAFVVNESNGAWGNAIETPGTSSLDVGGAATYSISCPSNGNCSAAGQYTDASGNGQGFVVSENDGAWANAEEIPGSSSLFTQGIGVNPVVVSCGLTNDCSAGGVYFDSSGNAQAFVVEEVSGNWGDAVEVPGTGALNSAGGAFVSAISCAADSSCAAGGWYATGAQQFQAFTSDMVPLFSTQSQLRLTSVKGTAGVALKLTTSGGSGTGKLAFSVQSGPGVNCVVTGDVLKANGSGVCVVTATKSGDATYLPAAVTTSVHMSLPPKPRELTLTFAGSSSALSGALRSELTALSKKLIANAVLVVTGYASGNARLARARAEAVESFLDGRLKVHVVIKTNVSSSASSVTVVTSKQ